MLASVAYEALDAVPVRFPTKVFAVIEPVDGFTTIVLEVYKVSAALALLLESTNVKKYPAFDVCLIVLTWLAAPDIPPGTLIVPPTYKSPPRPNPPATVNAPVVVELATVVAVNATERNENNVLDETPLGGIRVRAIGYKSSYGVFIPNLFRVILRIFP